MKIHQHKYRVTKESVFGLSRVHAIGKCIGKLNKFDKCREKKIRVLDYAACIEKISKTGRKSYFFFDDTPASVINV